MARSRYWRGYRFLVDHMINITICICVLCLGSFWNYYCLLFLHFLNRIRPIAPDLERAHLRSFYIGYPVLQCLNILFKIQCVTLQHDILSVFVCILQQIDISTKGRIHRIYSVWEMRKGGVSRYIREIRGVVIHS